MTTEQKIAYYTDLVEYLSPNEFGKYPFSCLALELAISILNSVKREYDMEISPVQSLCMNVNYHFPKNNNS